MVSYTLGVPIFLISYIAAKTLSLNHVHGFTFTFNNDFFDFQPPPREEKSYADKKCPYEVLGVEKDSTHKEIRKAFFKLSKMYHPDVNSDPDASDKFKELNEAYEILSNNDKREAYDKYGFAGLDKMAQMGGMPEEYEADDLFSSFFGSGGFQHRGERKAEPVVYPLAVPLDYLYTGKQFDVTLELTRLCKDYEECEVKRQDCHGPGLRVMTQQRGYGMFIQHQMRDDSCIGRGKGWKENCKECPDGPLHKEQVKFTVNLEPGFKNKHTIVMEGRGQEMPGHKRGDVVFVVNEKPHKLFRRDGNNLHCKIDISLKEALTRFTRKIDIFGKTSVTISQTGVTPHDYVFKVEGKGMPLQNSSRFGNLFVTVNVVFPQKLTPAQVKAIEENLD